MDSYNGYTYYRYNKVSKISLKIRTPGSVKMRSPYPEFVLIGVIHNEKALKGTEIVFVLPGISY